MSYGRQCVLKRTLLHPHDQEWLAENFHDDIISNIWPSNFLYMNLLDYDVLGISEKSNQLPHDTKNSLKATIKNCGCKGQHEHNLIQECIFFQGWSRNADLILETRTVLSNNSFIFLRTCIQIFAWKYANISFLYNLFPVTWCTLHASIFHYAILN